MADTIPDHTKVSSPQYLSLYLMGKIRKSRINEIVWHWYSYSKFPILLPTN